MSLTWESFISPCLALSHNALLVFIIYLITYPIATRNLWGRVMSGKTQLQRDCQIIGPSPGI